LIRENSVEAERQEGNLCFAVDGLSFHSVAKQVVDQIVVDWNVDFVADFADFAADSAGGHLVYLLTSPLTQAGCRHCCQRRRSQIPHSPYLNFINLNHQLLLYDS
jgi:hypothetical protein